MLALAFSLGLLGSLHCIGMCGPLAIAFSTSSKNNGVQNFLMGLKYNLGRTSTYAALGMLFGSLGNILLLADLQKFLSIGVGIFLIISFLFKIDLQKYVNDKFIFRKTHRIVSRYLSNSLKNSQAHHPYLLGLMNGLLPCGLVYLALAGSIASGSIMNGTIFMTLFGLGTIPALIILSTGTGFVSPRIKLKLGKAFPLITLTLGIVLLFRGLLIDIPIELNFWNALNKPIMCH